MESNITEQQYLNGNLQLSEPHFEEESTVLSARPVVPLQEIKAELPLRRRTVFGLSILVSLMVGALGATLIYKQRGQKPTTAVVETAVAGAGATAQAPAANEASIGEAAKELAQAEVPKPDSAAEHKKTELHSAQRVERAEPQTRRLETARQEREQRSISQMDEREMRHEERVELRRRRRAEREPQNEPRRHRGKSSDDLLRIREIFEGSPRP